MALSLSATAPTVPAASFTPALNDIKSSAQNVVGDLELMQDRLTRKFVNTVMDLGDDGRASLAAVMGRSNRIHHELRSGQAQLDIFRQYNYSTVRATLSRDTGTQIDRMIHALCTHAVEGERDRVKTAIETTITDAGFANSLRQRLTVSKPWNLYPHRDQSALPGSCGSSAGPS